LARLRYRVMAYEAEIDDLKESLRNEQNLKAKVSEPKEGMAIYNVDVDVSSFQHRKDVETLIRTGNTAIVDEYVCLEPRKAKEVKEKISIKITRWCIGFVITYAIILTNIIIPTLQSKEWQVSTLTNGLFPWWLVLLLSLPSAFGSVFSVSKLQPNPEN
jgi:hypothetical protein